MKSRAASIAPSPEHEWATQWLSAVADGRSTMSQRKLTSIDKRAGSIGLVKSVAKDLGVHLVQLTDDQGNVLVAASKNKFKVIA